MPHNFVKINAMTPNPGPAHTREGRAVCKTHMGTFENLWFDDAQNPDLRLRAVRERKPRRDPRELHALEVIRLDQAP